MFFLLHATVAVRADTTALWDGSTAGWTDAIRWSTTPLFPNNSGANFFDATVNAGAVTLDSAITVNRLTLGGGALDGPATLTALEGMQWSGGTIRGSGVLTLGDTAATTIAGGLQPLILTARAVNLFGTTNFTSGTVRGGSGATILNATGATFTTLGDASFFADFASPVWTFNNPGTFIARSTAGVGFTSMDARFNSSGTVRVEVAGTAAGHTLSLAGGGTHSGRFELDAGTAVELGGITTLQSGAAFSGPGRMVVAGSVFTSANFTADHLTVALGELSTGSSIVSAAISGTQTGGTTRIDAGGILRVADGSGTWAFDDGMLTGAGALDASLQAQGTIGPGSMLGTLRVTGSVELGSDARLSIEIGGAGTGAFDVLAVDGATSLDGRLNITLANGFRPDPAQAFAILTSSAITGVFANAPLDGSHYPTADGLGLFRIHYTPGTVVLTAFIPEPSSSALGIGGAILCLARRPRRNRKIDIKIPVIKPRAMLP